MPLSVGVCRSVFLTPMGVPTFTSRWTVVTWGIILELLHEWKSLSSATTLGNTSILHKILD